MSNSVVGAVYAQIINDVVEAVRVDFEEGGVDDAVLGELKAGWQRKLTQMNVAAFPWDPKPAPPQENTAPLETPASAPAPTQTSNPNYAQSQLSPQPTGIPLSLPGAPAQQHVNGLPAMKTEPQEPVIKQEPGLQNHRSPQVHPAFHTVPRSSAQVTAAQRAAQALESQYGARAAASISAIQSGMPPSQTNQVHQNQVHQAQQVQRPGQQPQQPGQQPQQPVSAQQYRQSMAAATMQQRVQQTAHMNPPNGLPASQVDGASDSFEAVLLRRDAGGNAVEMGRADVDRMMHDQIMSRAKQMEGGGLMFPLKEATKHRSLAASKKRERNGAAQLDGYEEDVFKEEDVDADEINSDLDDPADEQEDDDDEDESSQMMLCMYDKVQRVKNKWKCTLKDGVLTVNGREYVFHKATGEYEW